MKKIIPILSIFLIIFFESLQARPSYNGSTPGCGFSGCHTFQNNMVSVSVTGYNVIITVSGTTGNVAGELVNNLQAVVTYNNGTSSNPFTLVAPGPGVYVINAGHKSPTVWDSATIYLLPPAAPGNLTAQVNFSVPSVLLNWSDNSSDESGFIIERQTGPSGTFEVIDTMGAGVTTFTDTSVSSLTYYYRVKAYNFYGSSVYSPTAEAIVPVELISFSASASGNKINLTWQTATEKNNAGFEVQRKINSEYEVLGFVAGRGTTTEKTEYSFTDELYDINSNQGIIYRLKQIDFNGDFTYSPEIEIKTAPENFALLQNYPNPFNPSTTISFRLQERSHVRLVIMNSLGEEAALLVDEEKEAGTYKVNFNAAGLSSGIYFCRIEAGNNAKTNKMIYLK